MLELAFFVVMSVVFVFLYAFLLTMPCIGKTEEEIRNLLWMWYATTTPHSVKCGEEFEEYKEIKQPNDTVH